MRHNPHTCRWCDTAGTPITWPPYPAKHLTHSRQGRIISSDLSLAARPDRQHCPAAAAVPVRHGLSRKGCKKYVYLLPKLHMPSPSQMDNPSQALCGAFSLEDPFATGRCLPQHTLCSPHKPREMHKHKSTAQWLPSSQIGMHMHTCPRTPLFPYTNIIL